MKLKQRHWILIGILAIILALIWRSGGFREMFTGNPIPTMSDLNSISASFSNGKTTVTGTPSSTLTSVFNWVKANVPFPSGTTDNDIYGAINMYVGMMFSEIFGNNDMTPFINFVSTIPAGGSVTDNTTKILNFLNSTYDQRFSIAEGIQQINTGQPSPPTQIYEINGMYWAYVYLFGKPSSASPIAAKTNSTPSPASSSSTQPMTLSVPSPCRPSYKSIPGGSMEFKCFS